MAHVIEVLDGDAGSAMAEAIEREVYPPEVMARTIWREVAWAEADRRIFVGHNQQFVTHVGIYIRVAHDAAGRVLVGGIGSVMTRQKSRGKGAASVAMRSAGALLEDAGCVFGLLFCEPNMAGFYDQFGWKIFEGDVYCEQPTGRRKFDLLHAMILPIERIPAGRMIDLCGRPW